MFPLWNKFHDDELIRVSIRRVVNTKEIDALSTSHLHLTMTEFTLAQRIRPPPDLYLNIRLFSAPFTELQLRIVSQDFLLSIPVMNEDISKRKVTVFNVFWSFKLVKIVTFFAYIIEKLSVRAQECYMAYVQTLQFPQESLCIQINVVARKSRSRLWLWQIWSACGYSGTQQCLPCLDSIEKIKSVPHSKG